MNEVSDRLAEEFAGVLSHETIARLVAETEESFRTATVVEFLPVLTYRHE